MKKKGGGSFFEKQLSNDNCTITAVKCYDNKPVFLASSYESCSNTIVVKRWDFATQKEIDVLAPALVPAYNSFMGQVDNIGRFLAAFRIKLAVKKRFYMRIIFHFCNLSVINSWLLYRRDCDDCGYSKLGVLVTLQ